MFLTEKELAVEVAEVDRVKVDHMYLPKSSKNEVLEKFAPNAASTDQQHSRLLYRG